MCVTHFLTLEEHFRMPTLPIRDRLQVWVSGQMTPFYAKGPGWSEERGSVLRGVWGLWRCVWGVGWEGEGLQLAEKPGCTMLSDVSV